MPPRSGRETSARIDRSPKKPYPVSPPVPPPPPHATQVTQRECARARPREARVRPTYVPEI
eukprot:3744379-Prymnesium_polylepis.1